MKQNKKYCYDHQEGIFIFEDEISINWLISQVLNTPDLQISKVSNEQLQDFLALLSNSDLRMPNGQHSLFWLKDQLKEKLSLSQSKNTEAWHNVCIRFKFIIEQIDQILVTTENLHEKMELKKEQQCIINRQPNNMQAFFEPLESV